MRGFLLLAAFSAPLGLLGSASAQVIFEPVQYQYGARGGAAGFYYGGRDGRRFDEAARRSCRGPVYGPPCVFTDQLPYANAALFGYTSADARNEANAAVPTYFRKADLLRDALPSGDGRTWVVPAQAPFPPPPSVDVRPYHRPSARGGATTRPATAPAAEPKPLLIIPRQLLQNPPPAAGSVADAGR